MMQSGGNEPLKNFLNEYNIEEKAQAPLDFKYKTKACSYYR